MDSSKRRFKQKEAKFRKDIEFGPNQLLAVDKKASQLWDFQFSQSPELDSRRIRQTTRQTTSYKKNNCIKLGVIR